MYFIYFLYVHILLLFNDNAWCVQVKIRGKKNALHSVSVLPVGAGLCCPYTVVNNTYAHIKHGQHSVDIIVQYFCASE